MKAIKTKNFGEAIILIKILEDGRLLVVDSSTTVRYFEKRTLTLIDGFKAKVKHSRYKTDVVSFSNDGNYFATMSSDCRDAKLYDAKSKKIIAKIDRHQGEISCIGMDPSNHYMFSCGDDGKTFAIDIKSGKLAFTLPAHVDTINDISFSSNAQWVATASYDRKVSVFNLAMMTHKFRMKGHSAPIMKLVFLCKQRLCSVDKNSKAIIWNIFTGKIIQRLNGIHDSVTHMIAGSDYKFLFIGTELGYVLVYDLNTYELLDRKYIKLTTSITSMVFDEDTQELILGTDDGDLLFYNIYEGEKLLKDLLKKKDINSIQNYVNENPILAYTKVYNLISNLWEKTLAKAKVCLERSDKKGAIALFKPFNNIPAKNKVIQKVMMEYAEFDKFVSLVKQGKISLAYGVANQHPLYKETAVYKSLETQWKKTFAIAQKYALDIKGIEQAREILAPYRGISEKTILMQELFAQGAIYKRFKNAFGQKDFKLIFELIKQHPFLKEFPEYITLTNYGDTLYIKAQGFLQKGEIHSCMKLLRILVDFTDFTEDVKELMKDIEAKQKFYKAIEDDDIVQAYNLLDISEKLYSTDDGKILQNKWNSTISLANSFAVNGDAIGVKQSMEKYMKITSKYMALATLFGWCYTVQLENAIKQKIDKNIIEHGIKNYLLTFGLQEQIENLFLLFQKYYPDTKLNLELQTKGSMKMWRPSMIVNSILD